MYIVFEAYYVSLAVDDGPRPPLPRRIDQRAGHAHLWRNGTVRVRKLRGRLVELVTYVGPLLALDVVLIKKFRGVAWTEMVRSGGYDPAQLTLRQYGNTTASTMPANIAAQHFLLPSVHNFTLASPLQLTRALPPLPPSARTFALQLIGSLVLYDALFFALHLAFHKVPPLYRRVHATHHAHAEIHAQITNQLDMGERLALVLTANFALQIIGAHVLTRTAFVPLFVLFLVQNHSGLDVLSYDKVLPKGWGAGPTTHAQHHRLETVGYAPYFCWCDRVYEWMSGGTARAAAQRQKDGDKVEQLLERRRVNMVS